jgi:hypothetical protein
MQYPNPFGGPPIGGNSIIRVTDYDSDASTLTIETEDRTDPDAIKEMMPALLAKFAPNAEAAQSDERIKQMMAAMPPIESVMTGRMVYSIEDGFPLDVEVTAVVGAPGHPMGRSDTWAWHRVEPPD